MKSSSSKKVNRKRLTILNNYRSRSLKRRYAKVGLKKIASLILIAVFAVAVAFVGCKKEEAPAPEQQVQEQPAEEAPVEAPAQK